MWKSTCASCTTDNGWGVTTLFYRGIPVAVVQSLSSTEAIRVNCIDMNPQPLSGKGATNYGTLVGIVQSLEEIIAMWPETQVVDDKIKLKLDGETMAIVEIRDDIKFHFDPHDDGYGFTSFSTNIEDLMKYSLHIQKRIGDINIRKDMKLLDSFMKM